MTTQAQTAQTQTAQELIDAGKAVLFMLPTMEQCDFSVVWHAEDTSPEGQFDNPEDVKWINEQLEAGNEWAWCCIEVRCDYAQWQGNDYLGGCSYKSKRDFMQEGEGQYYPDMKQVAYDNMIADIKRRGLAVGG